MHNAWDSQALVPSKSNPALVAACVRQFVDGTADLMPASDVQNFHVPSTEATNNADDDANLFEALARAPIGTVGRESKDVRKARFRLRAAAHGTPHVLSTVKKAARATARDPVVPMALTFDDCDGSINRAFDSSTAPHTASRMEQRKLSRERREKHIIESSIPYQQGGVPTLKLSPEADEPRHVSADVTAQEPYTATNSDPVEQETSPAVTAVATQVLQGAERDPDAPITHRVVQESLQASPPCTAVHRGTPPIPETCSKTAFLPGEPLDVDDVSGSCKRSKFRSVRSDASDLVLGCEIYPIVDDDIFASEDESTSRGPTPRVAEVGSVVESKPKIPPPVKPKTVRMQPATLDGTHGTTAPIVRKANSVKMHAAMWDRQAAQSQATITQSKSLKSPAPRSHVAAKGLHTVVEQSPCLQAPVEQLLPSPSAPQLNMLKRASVKSSASIFEAKVKGRKTGTETPNSRVRTDCKSDAIVTGDASSRDEKPQLHDVRTEGNTSLVERASVVSNVLSQVPQSSADAVKKTVPQPTPSVSGGSILSEDFVRTSGTKRLTGSKSAVGSKGNKIASKTNKYLEALAKINA